MKKIFSILALSSVLGLSQEPIQHYETAFKYAPIRISVSGPEPSIRKELDDLLPWIEHFSSYYEGSGPLDQMLYKAKVGDTLTLDSTSYQLIEFGAKMHKLTDGELDIGIGNLLRAWGIGWGQKSRVPSNLELDSLKKELLVFPWKILAKSKILVQSPQRHIAMGSYLEARILKEIDFRLEKAGAHSWLVEVGGDFSFKGFKPNQEPWVLGIKDPAHPQELIATLKLSNPHMRGFSTSGDYEQKFTDSTGRSHHHIFDPRTGQSSVGAHAVSVLSTDPLINDALDTYFMIADLNKVKSTLAKIQGQAEAILFLDNGKVWVSPGLRSQLHFEKPVEFEP